MLVFLSENEFLFRRQRKTEFYSLSSTNFDMCTIFYCLFSQQIVLSSVKTLLIHSKVMLNLSIMVGEVLDYISYDSY